KRRVFPEGKLTGREATEVIGVGDNEPSNNRRLRGSMLVTGISWERTKRESMKQSVDLESNSVRNCKIIVECSSVLGAGLANSVTKVSQRELSYVSEDAFKRTSLCAAQLGTLQPESCAS